MTAVAFGLLAAGAAGAHLFSGTTGLLRDLTGLAGVTLLSAAFASGNLSWLGTLSYLLLAVTAIGLAWTTPWLWPARPPADRGAAICTALVFASGLVGATRYGARNTGRS
jgi:hypothetical protein